MREISLCDAVYMQIYIKLQKCSQRDLSVNLGGHLRWSEFKLSIHVQAIIHTNIPKTNQVLSIA